jgi:Spondin_N
MRVRYWLTAMLATVALGITSAQATQLVVTVQNLTSAGSLSLSPLFVAFHNGSFDTFNAGASASPALESLAELGDASGLAANLATTDPGAMWGLIPVVGPSGLPQIEPGESGSMTFNVNGAVNRFFSFAAMVVPSNDAFTSNDNPMATMLFGAGGHFLGPKTILLTGNDVWDAGTEVDGLFGSAFIVGQDATQHIAENGVVMLHSGFGVFDGQMMPNGQIFNVANADVGAGAGFSLARITITQAPEPGSLFIVIGALGLGAFLLRRRTTAI